MKRQSSDRVSLCESLESRTLFSSTLSPAKADLAKLATDAATLKVDLRTSLTDVKAAVAAGTGGRKVVLTDLKTFRSDATAFAAKLSTDFAALKTAINSNASNASALLNSFIAEAKDDKATLEADGTAVVAALTKHSSFLTSKVVADKAAAEAAGSVVNADLTQLKSDLKNVTA